MKKSYKIKMGETWKRIRLLRGETWKQTNVSLEGKNKNIVTRIQNLGDDMHLCLILKFKQTPMSPIIIDLWGLFFQIFRSLIRKVNEIAFRILVSTFIQFGKRSNFIHVSNAHCPIVRCKMFTSKDAKCLFSKKNLVKESL
jgi:hypothetical protein